MTKETKNSMTGMATIIKTSQMEMRRRGCSYLVMIYGDNLGHRYEILDTPIVLGRSHECAVELADESISRKHCEIIPEQGQVVIRDKGSTNGTYVNGKRISVGALNDGDQVMLGRVIFKYIDGDNIESAYHEEIFRLMTTDHLTGAANKKAFDNELTREFHRYFRHHRPLSLAMLDIDHFKHFNDTYGHLAGDRVLAQLGKTISAHVRMEDIFARYGGEEFAVLMPEQDLDGAATFTEKIRTEIANADFQFESQILKVTISIGVAQADLDMRTPSDFIKAADKNLYKAKDAGRNCVIVG